MFWFFWLQGMWDLSSPTRDRTHTPCIGRQSLNHWTAREVSISVFLCVLSWCEVGGYLVGNQVEEGA